MLEGKYYTDEMRQQFSSIPVSTPRGMLRDDLLKCEDRLGA